MTPYTPTVLVVEDNKEVRSFLRAQLTDQYQVCEAENGLEGWRRAQEEQPDLLLSDVRMPELTGVALCRRLREDPNLKDTPVILLTDPSDDPDDERLHAAADDVLVKPFSMDELYQRVDRHLPTRELPEFTTIDEAGTFLKDVVRVIELRVDDPDFTVAKLADEMNLSRRHLTRRVKAETGRTPATLIRARRIERAKEQLKSNPDTIAQVAQRVGFRSPSHFSQTFRQYVGCPPSTYLERHAE